MVSITVIAQVDSLTVNSILCLLLYDRAQPSSTFAANSCSVASLIKYAYLARYFYRSYQSVAIRAFSVVFIMDLSQSFLWSDKWCLATPCPHSLHALTVLAYLFPHYTLCSSTSLSFFRTVDARRAIVFFNAISSTNSSSSVARALFCPIFLSVSFSCSTLSSTSSG